MSTTRLLNLTGVLLSVIILSGAGCGSTVKNSNAAPANKAGAVVNSNVNSNANVVNNSNSSVNETPHLPEPTVTIIAPKDNATVSTHFNLQVAITNFTFAPDAVGKASVSGQGHYHVWLDGVYDKPGVSNATPITLTAGKHTLLVTLQNNDHSDLTPAIKSQTITVTAK